MCFNSFVNPIIEETHSALLLGYTLSTLKTSFIFLHIFKYRHLAFALFTQVSAGSTCEYSSFFVFSFFFANIQDKIQAINKQSSI